MDGFKGLPEGSASGLRKITNDENPTGSSENGQFSNLISSAEPPELPKSLLDRVQLYHAENGVGWFVCRHCPYKTTEEASMLRNHLPYHMQQARHQCPSCSFSADSAELVLTHTTDVHDPERQSTVEEKYHCRHCPFRTQFPQEFSDHTLFHVDSNRFHCSLCSFCASDQLTVVEHEAIHFTQRPWKVDGIVRVTRKYQRADDKTPFFIPGDMLVPYPATKYPAMTEEEKKALEDRLKDVLDVSLFF